MRTKEQNEIKKVKSNNILNLMNSISLEKFNKSIEELNYKELKSFYSLVNFKI